MDDALRHGMNMNMEHDMTCYYWKARLYMNFDLSVRSTLHLHIWVHFYRVLLGIDRNKNIISRKTI